MKNLLAINSYQEKLEVVVDYHWPFTPKEEWEVVEAARQTPGDFVSGRHKFRVAEMREGIYLEDNELEEREWLMNRWGVWLCTQIE